MTTLLAEAPVQNAEDVDLSLLPNSGDRKKLPREGVRWRIARLCIAIPLLLFSFAELLPFAVLPVSTQAVVNARLSEVKSPMEGELGQVTLETGDVVSVNEPLTTASLAHSIMSNEAIGDSRSRADMGLESSRIGAELQAAEAEKARYDQMYSQYLKHNASNLDMQVREAQTALASSQKKAAATADSYKRAQQALKEHLISKQMVDDASDKADLAERDFEQKGAEERRLAKQASDARSGFILDQTLTPPFIVARDNATSQVERLRDQKAALDLQINQPDTANRLQDTASLVKTTIVSPVAGTIWSRAVATGQTVQQGAELFRIADANSIHVEVWLDRRYGPQLSIGDTALIYLGGMGKELTGRVTSFEGTSRRLMEEEVNAIDLQAVHPDQYHVSIELDPSDRKAAYIGQSAKVLFPGSKHRLRASIYFWLTRL